MIYKKIKQIKKPLEIHTDHRGFIADIFYKEKISHVAFIKTKKNKIRGNHYHKKTTQIIFITQGKLEYWYKSLKSKKAKKKILYSGDIVITPPYEIHALRTKNYENEFIVFSKGLRGGKDYEKDTFRVENIIE
jgi:dTDP-4-dehydrorhamnose 3,5-epimerase-like enzyme